MVGVRLVSWPSWHPSRATTGRHHTGRGSLGFVRFRSVIQRTTERGDVISRTLSRLGLVVFVGSADGKWGLLNVSVYWLSARLDTFDSWMVYDI